jgi:hypothetical protein
MTSLNATENGTASNRDSVNQFHAIHFEQGSLAKSTPVGRVINSAHNPTAYSVNEGKESTRFLFQYGHALCLIPDRGAARVRRFTIISFADLSLAE